MTNSLGNKDKMAANIRRLLEKRGLTQKDLADEIGVPPSTVYNWCQAATYPRIDKIEKMANFFGVNKVDLVEAPEDVRSDALERAFGDRPDLRALFSVAENATPEDIEKTIRILEALKGE